MLKATGSSKLEAMQKVKNGRLKIVTEKLYTFATTRQ